MAIYQGKTLVAGAGTTPYINEDGFWSMNGVPLGPVTPTKLTSSEYQELIRTSSVDPGIAYYVIDWAPIVYPDIMLNASEWEDGAGDSFTYVIETNKIKTTDLVHFELAASLSLSDFMEQSQILQKARIQRLTVNGTNLTFYGDGIKPKKNLRIDISSIRTFKDTL